MRVGGLLACVGRVGCFTSSRGSDDLHGPGMCVRPPFLPPSSCVARRFSSVVLHVSVCLCARALVYQQEEGCSKCLFIARGAYDFVRGSSPSARAPPPIPTQMYILYAYVYLRATKRGAVFAF